jgi:hypothetical protein
MSFPAHSQPFVHRLAAAIISSLILTLLVVLMLPDVVGAEVRDSEVRRVRSDRPMLAPRPAIDRGRRSAPIENGRSRSSFIASISDGGEEEDTGTMEVSCCRMVE